MALQSITNINVDFYDNSFTDFEKGFIRAEVTSYEDFVSCGSYTACKEKGVTTIKRDSFSLCSGLEKIVIPEKVSTIDKHSFDAARNLKSIIVDLMKP